ncbi:MAG: hypothetical protein KTR15_11865 [Phycisphaeraceae bacterium]|nr:hypothetical protein [Phycisphaeraceae bacterium]
MFAQAAAQSGWVPYLVFESPGWLMAFFALCFAVTRIVGRRTGNPRVMRLSWIALGLVGLLFASSYFVTTPRERLAVALKGLLLAVEDKRLDDVRAMVAEDATIAYTGKESGRPSFMPDELTRGQMMERIDRVEFKDILLINQSAQLGPEPGYGTTGLRVNVRGSVGGFPGTNVSIWGIRWREVDGRWVAVRLECIEFGAEALFNRE